jgi:hypothetical protein
MHIIDFGGQADPMSLPLYTRKRTFIRNVLRHEQPAEKLRAAADLHRAQYPDIRLRSLTATYNCFGLVFASRRSALCDASQILTILRDDGFVRVEDRTDAQVGDVVLYRQQAQGEIHHVGIISAVRFDVTNACRKVEVLSKWGEFGEYFHDEAMVPLIFGQLRDYWTERKEG